jgi:PTS system galactitol-specific IIA component
MKNETKDNSRLIIEEDLIEVNIDADDFAEAITVLSRNFLRKNYVKRTFPDALIEREKTFPTGLETNRLGIAIPHTDPKHVIKGSLGIGILKNPVTFQAMDTKKDVPVSIIFMLAITHPASQLKTLQKIMELIRDEQALLDIKNAKNKSGVMMVIDSFFGDLLEK